jgi:hypothetical protein
MYNFASQSDIEKNMPLMKKLKVSERARQPGQFLSQYKRHGKNLPAEWAMKRNAFIARTLPAYQKKKTIRRKLALLAWAYSP